ncbi:hypothetical protein CRENBAI_017561 [Crenichthys baileyi]|uniref:Uncharacterized protein n=1 Tax=Crenichthys baileyi TaxID=28760 RepID=A0AAV9SRS3_9TELE
MLGPHRRGLTPRVLALEADRDSLPSVERLVLKATEKGVQQQQQRQQHQQQRRRTGDMATVVDADAAQATAVAPEVELHAFVGLLLSGRVRG